jgi:hypothetical protein
MARGFIFFAFALFALVLSVMAQGESEKRAKGEGMRNWSLLSERRTRCRDVEQQQNRSLAFERQSEQRAGSIARKQKSDTI